MTAQYFGKYRGTVTNNIDPTQLGRIQASVPDVLGPGPTTWAMPCFPAPGVFAVPSVGSAVWIEFEKGDADFPIWTGCHYQAVADVPSLARTVLPGQSFLSIQSRTGSGLTISDGPAASGVVTIHSGTGIAVSISDAGIQIENGKGASIKLVGPAVTINNGALDVI